MFFIVEQVRHFPLVMAWDVQKVLHFRSFQNMDTQSVAMSENQKYKHRRRARGKCVTAFVFRETQMTTMMKYDYIYLEVAKDA